MSRTECELMIKNAIASLAFHSRPFKLFGLNATKEYADKVARHLNCGVTPHQEKLFDDGELYVKSGIDHDDTHIGNVRGHDVFVIQSLYADKQESVADKFMKLCIMIGSLRDASAYEVTAVIPHLAWARQDRKTEPRAPITTKYIAHMLECCGADRVLLFDAHNLAAEQNAFKGPIDNLEAKCLFADWFANRLIAENRWRTIKVLTPDSGGLARCERFRYALLKRLQSLGVKVDDIEIVIFDKLRVDGRVKGGRIVGDVTDSDVIIYDDMISTAATMRKACKAVVENKGRVYAICATHGLFCGKANDFLDGIDTKIVISDTIIPWRLNENNKNKLVVIDTTKLVADAIKRIHSGTGSIAELLKI